MKSKHTTIGFLKFYFVVYFLLFHLFSCTRDVKKETSKTVFRYNEKAGISSLDPAKASNLENIWAVNQLFNGLVQMNDSLHIQACIARDWKISNDGLEYTFYLRNDVYFHNDSSFSGGKGRKVTSSDFVFSFSRLLEPTISSATSLLELVNTNRTGSINGFSAINDSVFKIYLKKPYSPFLSILSMKFFSVVPKEAIEFYKDEFRCNPVGTGPFKFKIWEEGTRLVLIKNEQYFESDSRGERLPYLDAVSVSFIKDKETSFMELARGELDMLSGLDAFNPEEVLDTEGKLKPFHQKIIQLQTAPFLKTDYLGFQIDDSLEIVRNSPIRLKKIRQAINYAIDKEKIIRYFRNNYGIPAHQGFLPPALTASIKQKVRGYYYNPEKAMRLLEEAGYANGKGLPEITLNATDGSNPILEFIQAQLSEMGITVKINIEKQSVLSKAVSNNEFLFFKKSWVGDYADPENFMALFYSKNFSPKGFNYFHFSNKKFDELFDRSIREGNDSLRKSLYLEMDQLMMEEAPLVPLYYDQIIRLVSTKVYGLTTNPMNLLDLRKVKK